MGIRNIRGHPMDKRKLQMLDLFGESVTCPQKAPKTLINASYGFVEFWKIWPTGPRKVGKQQCLNKWARYECCNNATLICKHIEWLKAQQDWIGGFIPMPLTYLNQQRWVDWEPEPERVPVVSELDKIKAHDKKAVPCPAHIRKRMDELRMAA